MATSKALIVDGYCIAASVLKHRPTLRIFQMWHSIGSMKQFGYTILDQKEGSSSRLAKAMRMHKNYDYIFASSDAYLDDMMSGFNCSADKIKVLPLPRVDALKSPEFESDVKKRILSAFPELDGKNGKKNIVYCPTFRKDETGLSKAVEELARSADPQKYNLIIKLHPLSKIKAEGDNIYTCPGFSTFDTLFIADYVISDYSCIIYEAGLRDIPVHFFCFDIDEYYGGRGLAIDYSKCPGIKSEDCKEIMDAIDSDIYDMDYLRKYISTYVVPTEHAADDMAEFIINNSFKIKG